MDAARALLDNRQVRLHGDMQFRMCSAGAHFEYVYSRRGIVRMWTISCLAHVEDAREQDVEASGVVETFSVRLGPPDDRPWGIRDFTLIDPTGVLWRIGHVIAV